MARTGQVKTSLASHTVLVAGALGLAQVAAYGVSVIAARALGPQRFGIVAALLGILLIGNVVALGIQAVAARRLVHIAHAQQGSSGAALLRAGLVGGLGVAAATILVSPALMWLLELDSWPLLLIVALTFVPLTWAGAMYGVAQGRESYGRLAAAYALVGVGRGIGGVAGALLTSSVGGTIIGIAVGTALGAIAARVAVAPLVAQRDTVATHPLSGTFSESAHATHALLALYVLTTIDVLIARALLGPTDAGLYGVGAIIAKIAFWLPQFVGVVAFPRFADGRRARATALSLLAVAGIGLLVTLATAALPSLVVGAAGGAQYAALQPVAWLFAAAGAMFAIAQALLLTRLAIDDRLAVIAVWLAVGLLVALATWVLPHTVTGLVTSALAAGSALALAGLAVTVRELRSGARDS